MHLFCACIHFFNRFEFNVLFPVVVLLCAARLHATADTFRLALEALKRCFCVILRALQCDKNDEIIKFNDDGNRKLLCANFQMQNTAVLVKSLQLKFDFSLAVTRRNLYLLLCIKQCPYQNVTLYDEISVGFMLFFALCSWSLWLLGLKTPAMCALHVLANCTIESCILALECRDLTASFIEIEAPAQCNYYHHMCVRQFKGVLVW